MCKMSKESDNYEKLRHVNLTLEVMNARVANFNQQKFAYTPF